jgi:hypothetical protein
MASSGMLRRVALVRTDVSEESSASFIRMTRIGELGTMLAVTRNRRIRGVSRICILVYWAGVRMSPLGTSANSWPIVPAPDDE